MTLSCRLQFVADKEAKSLTRNIAFLVEVSKSSPSIFPLTKIANGCYFLNAYMRHFVLRNMSNLHYTIYL